jgi:hypothetical protein
LRIGVDQDGRAVAGGLGGNRQMGCQSGFPRPPFWLASTITFILAFCFLGFGLGRYQLFWLSCFLPKPYSCFCLLQKVRKPASKNFGISCFRAFVLLPLDNTMAGQGLIASWWRDGPALPALTFGTGPPDGDPRAESVRRARLSVGAAPLLNDINRAIGGPLSRISAQPSTAPICGVMETAWV